MWDWIENVGQDRMCETEFKCGIYKILGEDKSMGHDRKSGAR